MSFLLVLAQITFIISKTHNYVTIPSQWLYHNHLHRLIVDCLLGIDRPPVCQRHEGPVLGTQRSFGVNSVTLYFSVRRI